MMVYESLIILAASPRQHEMQIVSNVSGYLNPFTDLIITLGSDSKDNTKKQGTIRHGRYFVKLTKQI